MFSGLCLLGVALLATLTPRFLGLPEFTYAAQPLALCGQFLITICWSLPALVVLGGGFALRDRAYRLLGLAVLAAAVGRIFCIDVWQLETIHRILSFLVLGIVLLALSFLYNRFGDTLRHWL